MSAANAQSAATDSTETVSVETPEKKPWLGKRLINKLNDLYFRTKYDTNYVAKPKEKWLLHLSALPSFVVYKHNRLTVNDEGMKDHGMCFNMVFNERASIVYHFTPRYNIGATLIMSNSIYNNDDIKINQNKWQARAFLGIRL